MPKALIKGGRPLIDYLGHIGGYATGIGAGCLIRQTNPYWGSVERQSFWTQHGTKNKDVDVKMLTTASSPKTQADTGR